MAFRFRYALERLIGWQKRRLPAVAWESEWVNRLTGDVHKKQCITDGVKFFFHPDDREAYGQILRGFDDEDWTQDVIGELACGKLTYFSHLIAQTQWPPSWHVNPFTERGPNPTAHFSQIDDFACGDIKVLWEASRFAFVYDLVRSYWRSGDARCPEMFWQAVEDWREQNPPHVGVNWKCGQETSIRSLAWCFGLWAFADHEQSTEARVSMLVSMLAVSANRIEGNLSYALSQNNNHGLSEANGLWTIGLLFPFLPRAIRWREVGRKAIEMQVKDLIADDGSFSQHSANYHRVMLQTLHWAVRLDELNDQTFSATTLERVRLAGRFIQQLQDSASGCVPNYGPNDGALVLPLSNCQYTDFRPLTQAASYLRSGKLIHEDGPWDEEVFWLFGPATLQAPRERKPKPPIFTGSGGCHVLRDNSGMMMMRAQTYRHRPNHMDQLHADLWWQGINVAVDPGTYSYNGQSHWADIPLKTAAYHNTVTIDGRDQSELASRFLYLPWPKGRLDTQRTTGDISMLRGSHEGYRQLDDPVNHERTVAALNNGCWIVHDQLKAASQEHDYRLHWLIQNGEHTWDDERRRLVVHYPGTGGYAVQVWAISAITNATLVGADPSSPRGWWCPSYGQTIPALSLAADARANTVALVTIFSPQHIQVDMHEHQISLRNKRDEAKVWLDQATSDLTRISSFSQQVMELA